MDAASAVREFCARWPEMTKDEIASHFTDDAVYVNIPFPGETIGGTAIAEVLHGPFMAKFARIEATVHQATTDGQYAFAERTERFTPRDGDAFELPVVGVFEVRGDKFCAWRDYFDRGHWQA
jgi:limonene-1,2-epoxide hydrolase